MTGRSGSQQAQHRASVQESEGWQTQACQLSASGPRPAGDPQAVASWTSWSLASGAPVTIVPAIVVFATHGHWESCEQQCPPVWAHLLAVGVESPSAIWSLLGL